MADPHFRKSTQRTQQTSGPALRRRAFLIRIARLSLGGLSALALESIHERPVYAARAGKFKPPASGQIIYVSIDDQHVWAYADGESALSFACSTGAGEFRRTLPGKFEVQNKLPMAYSDSWGLQLPYWMGIYYIRNGAQNGFHALPIDQSGKKLWGDKIGTPASMGCVVLKDKQMRQLYRWAQVGTPVVIE